MPFINFSYFSGQQFMLFNIYTLTNVKQAELKLVYFNINVVKNRIHSLVLSCRNAKKSFHHGALVDVTAKAV